MKRLLDACKAVLYLALAVSVIILSGAAGLRLLHVQKTEAGAETIAPPPPPSAVQTPAPAEDPAPTPDAALPVSSDKAPQSAPQAAALPEKRVFVLDFDRIMKESAPGKAVNDYAARYTAVMDTNLKNLNAALNSKRKKYNTATLQQTIAQVTKQRESVYKDARNIVRGLVRSAAATSPLKDALLIDKDSAAYLPDAFDRTSEIISYIDLLKLNLPDPPKPIEIK